MSQIQCAVFKGNTRGIFVDKREYEGNLWEQVEQAYQFVLRNIHEVGKEWLCRVGAGYDTYRNR